MRRTIFAMLLLATSACNSENSQNVSAPASEAAAYDLEAQRAKIVPIKMDPDTSFLNAEEREVINLLIQAADLMNPIFLRQKYADNPKIRAEIASSQHPKKTLILDMFDLNYGPWDQLAENHPFYGDRPMPPGAGFYPIDLTKEAFEAYLASHPEQRQELTSLYTVVRRQGDRLVAVPYSVEYREWLEPAAKLLNQAAARTSNQSLKRFLELRAKAFLTNDYYESELAWMDVTGTPIEMVIGPYEVYTDGLFGAKAAFEAYVLVQNPEESAALSHYKALLPDMERNLPVEDKYKNFRRPFSSPIIEADQVHDGGEAIRPAPAVAFNLPNDERVREVKGAKKINLSNVLGAKYEMILAPMAKKVLTPDQAKLVTQKYMTNVVLFHELSHSLGPGTITVSGRRTTVNEELKDQYSASEEAKADVMGVYNLLYLMDRSEIPKAERNELLATYFAGIFRAVRWGVAESHGRGASMQYGYLKAKGAFQWVPESKRFRVDYDRLASGIRDLTADLVRLQGDGNYAGMKAFFDRHAKLDKEAEAVLATTTSIPTDIQPKYPDRI